MKEFLSTFTLLYIVAVVAGLIIGLLVRRVLARSEAGREMLDDIYRSLGYLTLSVILPIHIFLTLVKSDDVWDSAYLPLMFGGGAAATFSILGVSWLLTRTTLLKGRFSPHYPYIAATFAGGGRSILLLAALAVLFGGALQGQTERLGLTGGVHLDMFGVFDVGYWIVFTTIIFQVLMKRTFAARPEAAQVPDPVKDLNPWPLMFGVGLGLLPNFIPPLKTLADSVFIPAWIDLVRASFAALIVAFSAMAVMLKVRITDPFREGRNILFVMACRALGLTAPVLLGCLIAPRYAIYVLLIAATYVLSPPSSLIDRMLAGQGASDDEVRDAVNLNVAWNVVLLAGAVLVMGVAALLAWSPGG